MKLGTVKILLIDVSFCFLSLSVHTRSDVNQSICTDLTKDRECRPSVSVPLALSDHVITLLGCCSLNSSSRRDHTNHTRTKR